MLDIFSSWQIKRNLKTKTIGQVVYFKESLDSTQNFLKNLAREGASEGAVVIARKQNKGKGRMGRSWFSPEGGVYLSCLLKPKNILLEDITQIALTATLSCCEAIEKITSLSLSVKWPNDIFLEGKKLGGILCETEIESGKIKFVTVGIGININTKKLPPEATSLFLSTKKKFSRSLVVKEILGRIEDFYFGLESGKSKEFFKGWQERCFLWGSRIRVKILDKVVEGEAVGIDSKGCLLVRRDSGLVDKISSGDAERIYR